MKIETRWILKSITLAVVVCLGLSVLEQCATAEDAGKTPPKETGKDAPKKDPAPGDPVKPDSEQHPPEPGADLRTLIGVNPVGLKRVDVPHIPSMSLRGFIQTRGQPPVALLEIAELNRVFLVKVGTEIPITVAGRISPIGRNELTGLGGPARAPAAPAASDGQSQIILKVLKVSGEGVTVEAGLLAQTIVIR